METTEEPAPFYAHKGQAVGDSVDLRRIVALPRRLRPSDEQLAQIAAGLKARFGKKVYTCECRSRFNRMCCDNLLPNQAWALAEGEREKGAFNPLGVGHGKAIALDTPIPTPKGWTTMGELSVGDEVFDSRGQICKVTFATEVQHDRTCYDVVFSDGSVITADADHRWLTRSYLERRQLDRGAKAALKDPQVRTTQEIKDSLYHRRNRNHAVDVAGALELPGATLPLDPYLLGAWLGDGSTLSGEITSADACVLAAFDKCFKRGHASAASKATTQYYLGLKTALRELGVLGNKHVPSTYLRASSQQRLALLQGLMDTDGHAANDSTVEFCSTSPVLASAVFELAASLGQLPKMYHGTATLNGKDCGPKYRICFQPTIPVFRMQRKLERLRLGRYKQSQIKSRRYIEAVRPRESVPVRCITVDSPDHSYLCGKAMITTHNTLLDLLMPMVAGGKTAVLLLPPNLKMQLLEVDWHYYGQHWQLPNLKGDKFYTPGRPFLHVVSFSELSGAKSTTLLQDLNPDVVVVDEAHALRNSTAARTKRFLRFLRERRKNGKPVQLYCWSGTLTSKSIKDYAHLAEFSLGNNSPVPLNHPTVEEWASHLDASDFRAPVGALAQLGSSPDGRAGYRRRLVESYGVVSSGDATSCQASLVVEERNIVAPAKIQVSLDQLEETWQRPDGEELIDALSVSSVGKQLSSGFFYRWRWPRKEPVPVIEKWLATRKEWRKELREKLKNGRPHMDSELLVTKAAIRWVQGYVHIDEKGQRHEVQPKSKQGPLPTWEAQWWPEWLAVRDTAQPETEAIWVDDYLVKDAVEWLKEGPGVLWYEHGAFAALLLQTAKSSGVSVLHACPGEKGDAVVAALTGRERVVASIKSHGTGKHFHQFSRALALPPSGGDVWEQLLGRLHRPNQQADEVTFQVYRHTEPFAKAVASARSKSEYIQETMLSQKLVDVATWRLKNE